MDIFVENPNKSNLIHSSILELFDYLIKDYNKKIAIHLMQNFEDKLLRHPLYSKYFAKFLDVYERKEEKKSPNSYDNDYIRNELREKMQKE